jgi:glycerophosphoryl diester phosphodiesterase
MAVVILVVTGPPGQAAGQCGSTAFAHRGVWGARVDENTIRSVERADKVKAFTENDVWLTRDGRFLIIHNKALNHTTNCRGTVGNWRLAAIRARCHTTPNRMWIPTAYSLFKTLAGNPGQRMNLEIKGPGWFDNDNAKLVGLRNVAVKAGVLRRVYFSNDATERTLTALRDSAPNARTAWKPDRGDRNITVARASRMSVDAVMAKVRQWTSATKVRTFKRAGFKVWAGLSGSKDMWKRAWRRGVKAQLTNDPGKYRKWCNSVG